MRSGVTDKGRKRVAEGNGTVQQGYRPTYANGVHGSSSLRGSTVDQHGRRPFADPSQAQQKAPAKKPLWRVPGPTEGWSVLILLAIALYCVVHAILRAEWVSNSNVLFVPPLIGLLVGLMIAKTQVAPQSFLHLIACVIGGAVSFWITASLAYSIPYPVLWSYISRAVMGQMPIQSSNVSEVIFFFYLAFLCFFLGYFGSWLVYRARLPWLVALVYSSIMLVNLNYISDDLTWIVMIMLAALVLLVARMQVLTQITNWMNEGLYADYRWVRSMTRRCMQVATIATVLVIVGSMALPVFAQPESGKLFWRNADSAWNNFISGRVNWNDWKSLTTAFQPSTNFFGDQLKITGSVYLPNGNVLEYSSTDSRAHYLQAFTFSQFDGQTWKSAQLEDGWSYEANTDLPPDVSVYGTKNITTRVKILQPPGGTRSYIFAPAQPQNFNVPVTVYRDATSEGTTTAWVKSQPLQQDASYSVISQLFQDENALDQILLPENGTGDWDTRYLNNYGQLYRGIPRNLSANVAKTTREWVGDTQSAYQALKAIERRLSDSSRFTYSLENPPVPRNKNAVDVLLQTRRGYCTFYASTMAMMGRVLGLPTRVVNGFSSGTYNADRGVWVVQGRDAHSWVQAYFPGYGWIDFDPTPGFSLNRSGNTPATPQATATPTVKPATATAQVQPTKQPTVQPKPEQGTGEQGEQANNNPLWLGLIVAIILGGIVLTGWMLVRRWWRTLYADNSAVAGAYWRFCYLARFVGLGPSQWQTPYEYSRMLASKYPQHTSPFVKLTDLYVRDRWGAPRHLPQGQEIEGAQRLWPALRAFLVHSFWQRRKGS